MDHEKSHLTALDGLRGFAALLVVISHSANHGLLPPILGNGLGKMGVIVFFGLSGFLMGYLYGQKDLTGKALWDYAVNRGTRVLPLYYFTVFIAIISFYAFDFVLLNSDGPLAIVQNIAMIRGSSTLWTIPVEIHFYFLFVIVWIFAIRSQSLTIAAALLSFQLVGYLALDFFGVGLKASIFAWLHIFLAGSLLGIHYPSLREEFAAIGESRLLSFLGWIVLVSAVFAIPGVRRELGIPMAAQYLDPITVGYPLLVLVLTVFAVGPLVIFRHHILRWFGKISYSLYLLHLIVLTFVKLAIINGLMPAQLGFPATLAVSSLAAWAAYTHLERPSQKALRSMLRSVVERRVPS
ncbi:acyltransferase family protein [Aurantiacibacter hainanensis]|uniref:acyltransferase family protein n=1 Tax=Aurantiacibacter hainanensis TaxID=3076114 RepID=UPI0030C75027